MYLLSSISMTKIIIPNKVHIKKLDDNGTTIKYVIVNKSVELARARQEIVYHDFSVRLEISKVQDAVSSENLWETVRGKSAKHVSGKWTRQCRRIFSSRWLSSWTVVFKSISELYNIFHQLFRYICLLITFNKTLIYQHQGSIKWKRTNTVFFQNERRDTYLLTYQHRTVYGYLAVWNTTYNGAAWPCLVICHDVRMSVSKLLP